jgi:hypothetical protein
MMMLEPGERAEGIEDVLARIRRTLEAENSTIIVAAAHDELVGYRCARRRVPPRPPLRLLESR